MRPFLPEGTLAPMHVDERTRTRPQTRGLSRARASIGASALLSLFLLGCEDLSRFSTGPSDAYCGAITLASSFRSGLSPRVQMRLSLDATKLDGMEPAGKLWTFEAASAATPERRLLDGAALRPIPPLLHDPLSHFEMGDGRERNAMYAVTPSDPSAESLLAFLSLRSDDEVEVRLVRAGSDAADVDEGRRPIYGMFLLSRREGTCGF